MSDPLITAALERLRAGFLGVPHREALLGLLLAVGRAVHGGETLPTPVHATFERAVAVLGTEPTTGGAE